MHTPHHETPRRPPVEVGKCPESGLTRWEMGDRLLHAIPTLAIDVIPLASRVTADELRSRFPSGHLTVCDFPVEGAELQSERPWGFAFAHEGIDNIDHHAAAPRMYRPVSSGNLSAIYVREHGAVLCDPTTSANRVIVHHLDCDSVISSLMMRGAIPPDQIFERAVIAADHTGERNEIADLLQALDVRRDLAFSARNLALLLREEPLEPKAVDLLQRRLTGRQETIDAVLNGGAEMHEGPLAVVAITSRMRNEYMPALFPSAVVIMTTEPGERPDSWVCRLRLGAGAPDGFTLFSLGMDTFDPSYGGRWNAGSNKRGGGSVESIEGYTERLRERLNAALVPFKPAVQ